MHAESVQYVKWLIGPTLRSLKQIIGFYILSITNVINARHCNNQ